MTQRASHAQSRADFHAATGVLLVVRQPLPAPPTLPGQPPVVHANPAEGVEILLALWDDGSVTALHGHVDLGTGLRTALTQVVAEELDLPMERIHMVLGDTNRAPNQGATIASASLQIHAEPLRRAAAQAKAWLNQRGAATLQEALAGQHVQLLLDLQAPVKDPSDYRVVGQSVPRVDLRDKLTGALVYVHDMRVPGMLHGRVVRPPYAGADHGDFIGNTLEAVDQASIAHIPGIRAVVVLRDFVGIVAEREEQAEQAMHSLRVRWKPWPGMPDLRNVEQALRNNPRSTRKLVEQGDVDAALAATTAGGRAMPRTYVWPYQMHASIGPSCAVADWQAGQLTVWAGTQNPHVLRFDLARLLGLPDVAIQVIRMEAAGCYGRNGADDVAADAALLSRAVAAPVRVQLSREQEHLWEPKGAAQLMEVQGGLNADGSVAAYDFQTSYPSNGAPTLALLLTRTIAPVAQAFEMGDRTARPPYRYANLRVQVHDMPPIVRASWLRGVSALPNAFAHESYIDELAMAAGVDPVAYRLRYLDDPRAAELVRATAAKAGWTPHTQARQLPAKVAENAVDGAVDGATHGDWVSGQGFAYARYIHSKWPGFGAAWAAWVADVEVNRSTGEVQVRRVVVGHDAGMLVNPAGVEHQIHGNVLQTTSRALKEQVQFSQQDGRVLNQEWGSYPILSFREVPVIEVLHMPRPGEAALGAGESASVPGTAAIANAIFDATGVRFRQPPFTPETVRAGLHPNAALKPPSSSAASSTAATPSAPAASRAALRGAATPASQLAHLPWPHSRTLWATLGALLAGAIGVAAALLGARPALVPLLQTGASPYTAATLERGRQLAALGNCVGCHTAPGGVANAGGRALTTPFGTVYSTNLTPDVKTGLGNWSLNAFQRAMREGISRDGHRLYPAFPFTSFAKTSDADLTALYAYLMAQPAVQSSTPVAQMRFPFSVRPLLSVWTALFHDPAPYQTVPPVPPVPQQSTEQSSEQSSEQSPEWNRGAYLVTGLGHCGACHTPRNALGAEQGGSAFLSGAWVQGWEAPALTARSQAPLPWNADALFAYLRHGHSAEHGIASGPMAPVVKQLSALPDADIRAMAVYLASFQTPSTAKTDAKTDAKTMVAQAAQAAARNANRLNAGQRLFEAACGACHHDGDGPRLLGLNTPLALSSKLHSQRPDNLLHTILHGIQQPAAPEAGFMPAFKSSLSDEQLADLLIHMRQRFAPDKPAWDDVRAALSRVRQVQP